MLFQEEAPIISPIDDPIWDSRNPDWSLLNPARPPGGERPCWEAPIFDYSDFDYSDFEEMIKAQQVISSRDAFKDVAWRTNIMDYMVERDLLTIYRYWVHWHVPSNPKEEEQTEPTRYLKVYGEDHTCLRKIREERFYSDLLAELHFDLAEMREERAKLQERQGGRDYTIWESENQIEMEAFPGRYIWMPDEEKAKPLN